MRSPITGDPLVIRKYLCQAIGDYLTSKDYSVCVLSDETLEVRNSPYSPIFFSVQVTKVSTRLRQIIIRGASLTRHPLSNNWRFFQYGDLEILGEMIAKRIQRHLVTYGLAYPENR
jgi:hypothetical protein